MSTNTHWLKLRGELFGPFNLDDLKRMAGTGEIVLTDEASDDQQTWCPVWQVLGMEPPAIIPVTPAPITGFSKLERGTTPSALPKHSNLYAPIIVIELLGLVGLLVFVVSFYSEGSLTQAFATFVIVKYLFGVLVFTVLLYEVRAIRNALKK